ncbi:hypothetical protein LCGC14_2412400, partial [marine sediment metagenome]
MGDLAPEELTATGEHPPRSSSMQFLLVLAALWVLFHLVAAGSGVTGSHVLRSVHLGGAIILTLCYKPLARSWRWIDALLILAVIVSTLYLVVRSDAILLSNWFTYLWPERILGAVLFVSLIEAVRRALGWGFVALITVFVGYAVLGSWIPGVFGHRGLSLDRLIFSFYLGSQGVTGMLIGISASIVALFLIFGEILNASGAGNTFINVALRIGGRLRGGAGMVAVIGSAAFALLVTIYSLRAMAGNYWEGKFYAYLTWALGGACIVGLAGNLLVLLVGWELVTLMLFLMINQGRDNAKSGAAKTYGILG